MGSNVKLIYLVIFILFSNKAFSMHSSIRARSKYGNLLRFLCFELFNDSDDDQTQEVGQCSSSNNNLPSDTCVICMEEKKTVSMLPCKHEICNTCTIYSVVHFKLENCPICRVKISTMIGVQPKKLSILEYERDYFTNNTFKRNQSDTYQRMTLLTLENFQELHKRIEKFKITNNELIAKYYYLRRNEEPDLELLKDIQVLNSNKNFFLSELRGCLLRCRNLSMELLVYTEWFETQLNNFEQNMLRKYYSRKGLNADKEFVKRKEYTFNPI
ncbi:uncharacterized protein LOC126896162 isoform X6 [Daktulosphaira vitifoliae]|uniref:uncharacterized protein LOC126896162 isoform X5 n=1 Tax=Daktulosphaira vitifoliae TaxID=58002 RepID=UPI0021A9DE12|nr:uncharacterized protein LOC126896162 isoform X5 [Daktulosphaira vitifoliae]XP_050524646.1 uncharacterized protein LOC126896162 isoform X6 [Daktulosphaira vitifoliae]